LQAERREAQKAAPYFVLLRAVGDLLMLPKDMLMDKSVRKEVIIFLPIAKIFLEPCDAHCQAKNRIFRCS
jgi:hypothetical protein